MAVSLQTKLRSDCKISATLAPKNSTRKSILGEPKGLFAEYGNQITWIHLRHNGELCPEKGQTLGSENGNSSCIFHTGVTWLLACGGLQPVTGRRSH